MFLNKIKLNNIRSYVSTEIVFPKGTTLLSGDIGSGKSSILLAIEFALFGLKKGRGAGLLRNGTSEGFVELDFDLDGENILIKRSLKRSKDKVNQGSGELNGESLSVTELKQRVLDLLEYPKEMLTKDSLIYRYTVYTPQEEMKFILLGDKDSRLDTLRKVFDIDKYKRIKENSSVFASYLREKIKELDGRLFDLGEKKILFDVKNKELGEKKILFDDVKPKFDLRNKKVEDFRKDITDLEKEVKCFNNFKLKLDVAKSKLEQNEKELSENKKKLDEIKIVDVDVEKIKILEEEVNSLKNLLNTLQNNIVNQNEIKEKISNLSVCPTCKQNVSQSYKGIVVQGADEKIKDFELKSVDHKQKLELKNKEFSELQKINRLNEINSRLRDELINKNKILDGEFARLKQDVTKFDKEISKLGNVEKEYESKRKELDLLVDELRKVEVEKIKIESEIESLNEILIRLKDEIKEKLKCKEEKEKWSKIQFFLKEQFLGLMQVMEKQIMFKVHGDFDSLFRKWFGMIISSDLLSVRLSDEFSPVIEQNGYEIDYGFLSGGEKTAIALAYRLALNQVINSLVSNIKTKDLLILDEPTDGFSSEQLDNVKGVLDELNIGQIIMVSHDANVESFVENVLRLNKESHVSKII